MKTLTRFIAAAACAIPLAALAQATPSTPAVVPADAPRTQLEQNQTQNNGQATKYGSPSDATKTSTKGKAHAGMKHDASNGAVVNSTPAADPSTNGMSSPTTTPSPTTPTAKNSGK